MSNAKNSPTISGGAATLDQGEGVAVPKGRPSRAYRHQSGGAAQGRGSLLAGVAVGSACQGAASLSRQGRAVLQDGAGILTLDAISF